MRKIQTLGEKVLQMEDAFSAAEMERIETEIAALRAHIKPTYHGDDVVLYRAYLDKIYQDRKQSFILQAIPQRLYDDALLQAASSIHDLSYTLLAKNHKFTTVLTEFHGDTDYRTHTDTGTDLGWTKIFMSWIWYYNPRPELMSGGQLVVEDLGLEIEPKHNTLVLLPAHLRHAVRPSVYTEEGYYRTTINGFLRWSDPVQPGSGQSTAAPIESCLAGASGVVASMLIPRPQGQLEDVREITAKAIMALETASIDIGTAPSSFRRGDTCLQNRQYREAFIHYRRAYQRALGLDR